jgi:SAM-dependent methyltransferase
MVGGYRDVKDIFGENVERYDAWYENNVFAYLSELDAIRNFLPRKGKGLEIGVGTGRFAGTLGVEWGIDPSTKVLTLARKRGILTKKGSGEKIPFKNGTFDYALSVVTLSFVKNPDKVIKEASRVIRKGGRLIVGIVSRNSFLGKHYLQKRGIFYKEANLLTPEEIKSSLLNAGFKDISFCQTIFTLPSKMRKVHKVSDGFSRGGFVVAGARLG